jgi:hypothetical protein
MCAKAQYLGHFTFNICGTLFYHGRSNSRRIGFCEVAKTELIFIASRYGAADIGLFKEILRGNIYYKIAGLFYDVIGMPGRPYRDS